VLAWEAEIDLNEARVRLLVGRHFPEVDLAGPASFAKGWATPPGRRSGAALLVYAADLGDAALARETVAGLERTLRD
jgi:hypothetical protein